MKRKHFLTALLVIVMVVLASVGFTACKPQGKDKDKEPNRTLVVGTTMTVDSLNRLDANGGDPGYNFSRIAYTVSQLTPVGKIDGKIVDISCKFTVSEDGKTVTLTQKDGYKWHDGKDVTIDDVEYTLRNYEKDKDYVSVVKEGKSLIYTVNDANKFLEKVALDMLMPKHIFEGKTKETLTDEESVIGAGPFKYAGRDENAGTITFEKFEGYPLADKVQFNKVVFKKYGSDDVLALALKKGEIDTTFVYAKGLNEQAVEALSGAKNVQLISKSAKGIDKMLVFNNQKMTNVNVKKAIALSIDYKALREKFKKDGIPSKQGLVGAGIDGYKETPDWARNLDEAKRLLKAEGYSETNKFQFELLVRSSGDDAEYASLLQTQIEETGLVEVTLLKKGADWQQYYQQGNHMASLVKITQGGYGMVAGYGSKYLLAKDTSLQENNPVAHGQMLVEKDGELTEFGKILNAMMTAKDKTERDKAVGNYQDYIMNNVLCVPFFYSGVTFGASSTLDGFRYDDITATILNVVTFETLKRV